LIGSTILFLSKNREASKYLKYSTPLLLNVFGFIATMTMGKLNRSIPFYFFSIVAYSLIYLEPNVVLAAAAGTILCHGILIPFFPQHIFATHQPDMYVYVGSIYLLFAAALYTISVKARSLLNKLKTREQQERVLNQNLNQIQSQIAVVATRLRDTSKELVTQANELLTTFHETASAMEQMAQMVDVETGEVTKVSTHVTEINTIAGAIKNMSNQLATDFNNTENSFQKGSALMHSTIDGLKKVSTQMEEVSSATGRLKDSSLKVNDVLVFMNEIAEKTTLLSLNANIEAARAGSAGHGFSVVASEISKLSVQSVRGTEEIKKIIGATLLDLESVLAAIDLSLEIVQKNAEESNAVTAELQLMMENIHANSAQISKIYQGMENLAQMNDAIMNGANNLASIAEETSAGTQEISATTQNQTTNVDRIVEQSKVLEQMASRLDVLVNPNA
jgi:methyl-accepting chemotaxis protein